MLNSGYQLVHRMTQPSVFKLNLFLDVSKDFNFHLDDKGKSHKVRYSTIESALEIGM